MHATEQPARGAERRHTASYVLGPTGNSRDFAYTDELGMLEFGAALHGDTELEGAARSG